MSSINQALVDEFKAKAGTVNAVVQEVPDLDAALQYVVDVCAAKSPCELLADEPGTQRGPNGPNGVPTRVQRIVAAPCLDEEHFARLSAACEAKGFLCLKDGLRSRLAGIDVGFSMADFGVAASALGVFLLFKPDTVVSVLPIRHLQKADELLGMRLAVMHNLYFYNHLMERIREALDNGTFQQFHDTYVHKLDTRI